ncbi:mitochondrial adenylate kinase, catalyzes the reversible synthesis of GTP and AMP from GDP and ADP [Hyaloraphidium curvatum]|nr:mitochondrial adenylate kinase, catalyzes the reversible synthesis of GTP and AMP from GDP and ADP [Hyaloraphidium curvatum]
MGSPGSGKGTQTERIQRNFAVEALSSGDLLRLHIAQGSEIGKLAARIIKDGGLVPDETMIALVLAELPKYAARTWMLDGFPRTRAQAEKLDRKLEELGGPLDHVLNLDVPAEVILKRIEDRWVHIPSGRVYNLSYNPPKVAGKDDVTGEPLSKRPDDNLETFKKRLDAYYALTKPLADYYAAQGKLRNFAGETSDEIYPKIHAEMTTWFQ